jgi:signal transduction histidine kinase
LKSSSPGSPRGLSLEYRLPLLITAVFLLLVMGGSVAAWSEVRNAALAAGTQRVERAAQQLANAVQIGRSNTVPRFQTATEDAAIRAWMRGAVADDSAAVEALARVTSVQSSGVAELRMPDGRVLRAGAFPVEWNSAQIDSARNAVILPDSVGGYSPIVVVDGAPYLWFVVAASTDGSTTVSRMRRIRPSGASDQIRELVGRSAGIYYANVTDGTVVSIAAEPVHLPIDGLPTETITYTRDGQQYLLSAAPINRTMLAVVTEMPLAYVLQRPARFLRSLIMAAIVLVGLGAIGAWLISRGITKPVKQLSEAAGRVAGGDYSSRVSLDRADELGALAHSFNTMAQEVESAQVNLHRQYDEARMLAEQLEATNEQLRATMAAAERARNEAEAANRAKSDFLATMSHEIRTPINAIIGYTEILRLGITGPVSTEQVQQLDRIATSSRHLTALVDDVLDLAHIESGRLVIADRTGRVRDAIDAALDVIGPIAEQAGVELRRADVDEQLRYRGDPQRVRQILINLVSNAVKFTPRGGVVEVGANPYGGDGDESSGSACLYVRDTGIGIAPTETRRIFEPFVQGVRGYTRSHGGVGLGLSISRRLARSMGGDLTVESQPGRGSTFTLRVPLGARPHAAV